MRFIKNNWLKREYRKTNFKLCLNMFIEQFSILLQNKHEEFKQIFKYCVRRSTERRTHLSREYPRVIRNNGKIYPLATRVPVRA